MAGGLVARFFIGLTQGYYNPELTVEDVRDHWGDIRDEDGYDRPRRPERRAAQDLHDPDRGQELSVPSAFGRRIATVRSDDGV